MMSGSGKEKLHQLVHSKRKLSLGSAAAAAQLRGIEAKQFGDAMAFYDALLAEGVRRVGFYTALAEDDVRN